jgi:hypothetical protein
MSFSRMSDQIEMGFEGLSLLAHEKCLQRFWRHERSDCDGVLGLLHVLNTRDVLVVRVIPVYLKMKLCLRQYCYRSCVELESIVIICVSLTDGHRIERIWVYNFNRLQLSFLHRVITHTPMPTLIQSLILNTSIYISMHLQGLTSDTHHIHACTVIVDIVYGDR